MAEALDIAGPYLGKNKIREGMESALTPVERKRIAKGEEAIPLILNPDGTFNHKKTTVGHYHVQGDRIFCKPEEFNGTSLSSMQQAAEQAGRSFGLSWLFEPFELTINGENLVSGNPDALIYVEYLRKGN